MYLTLRLLKFFEWLSINADTWGNRPNFQEHTSNFADLYVTICSSDFLQQLKHSFFIDSRPKSDSSLQVLHSKTCSSKPSEAQSDPSWSEGATNCRMVPIKIGRILLDNSTCTSSQGRCAFSYEILFLVSYEHPESLFEVFLLHLHCTPSTSSM